MEIKTQIKEKQNQQPRKISPQNDFKIHSFIIIALCCILYGNTLFNKYTLDDTLIITQNKFTKMGIKGIGKIISNDAFVGFFGENKNLLPGGRYRPLSQVIFAIEYQFTGLNPFLGHLVNLLTYAALCLLVYVLLTKLFKNYQIQNSKYRFNDVAFNIPFIATLLFAAHPLHTEAVANIKGLDEVLCMLLSVSILIFAIDYADNKKLFYLPLMLLMFLLAMVTKENAITFLAVIPLSLMVFRKTSVKDILIILAPILIGTVVYFIIRKLALGFVIGHMTTERELLNNPFLDSTTAQKYATIMLTWGKYLLLLLFPFNLTHDYYPKQLPIIEWGDPRAILPLMIYAGITVYALYYLFKGYGKNQFSYQKLISFGILFYLITFSIQSNLVFNIGAFMNERFVFVSLLGFCIIAAYYLNRLFVKNSKTATALLIIILLIYSVKTFTRNFVWYDDFTLFTTDVHTSSNSAKCTVSAGGMYYERSKTEKDSIKKNEMLNQALTYLMKGVEIHPQYVAGWMLLGNTYLEKKDYENARISYENILKLTDANKDAFNNLLYVAQTTDKKDMMDVSLKCFKLLIAHKPKDPDYLYQYASALAKSGKVDTALVILNNLVSLNSKYYNAYNKLGEVYGRYLNDMKTSMSYLMKAYAINPKDPSVLENLGVANGIIGRYDESVKYFKQAIAAKPENPQLYQNIAGTYRNMGNIPEADKAMAKSKELRKAGKE